ncbi:hypothetical protein ACH4UM_18770 [Streptomyces sp. NPDC020801]|uniref:hypothetical protein n=1 Tax=Streptomyces sp. NPDC020801 TaxID=3365093 RepID=UPI00378B196A
MAHHTETDNTQSPPGPHRHNGPSQPPNPHGSPEPPATPATAASGPHSPRSWASTAAPSPVAELRAAVGKLRKHVKHATDSPWVTSTVWSPHATATSAVYSHAHPADTVESEVVASGRIRSGYGGIREPWNAEYIALMQPTIGAALANWLHLEADVIEARQIEDGTSDFAVDLGGDHALAIARLINGEEATR